MKKNHQIKTIEDIKYCEEHELTIYSIHNSYYFEFEDGKWNVYDEDDKLRHYDYGLDYIESLYYYEEAKEQEATSEDVGKLCWFYDTEKMNNRKVVGKLREVLQDDNFPFRSDYGIPSIHCRPLTKAEIQEFMEKAE